ncbi:hypothetical protein AHAS_Ahas11G0245500 [Arachis hypogaea]
MVSRKRKQIVEDSSSERSNPEKESTLLRIPLLNNKLNPMIYERKRADIPEVGIPSTEAHYDSSKTFGVEEESFSDPAQQQMIIVQKETHSQSKLLKIQLAPQVTAALMMMARAVSFVPKEFPVPSFSLAFTDSSQEETLTQEERSTSEKGKSQVSPILVEDLEELVEQVANTGVAAALNFVEDRSPPLQKFEKFETPARMTEIVTTMCLILNKTRIKRFEEQVYCFPPDIVNMALGNHGGGEFLHSKTKKPFDIQDYSMFIPYLDMRKLASHSYVSFRF